MFLYVFSYMLMCMSMDMSMCIYVDVDFCVNVCASLYIILSLHALRLVPPNADDSFDSCETNFKHDLRNALFSISAISSRRHHHTDQSEKITFLAFFTLHDWASLYCQGPGQSAAQRTSSH